jgi:hypothetical protein
VSLSAFEKDVFFVLFKDESACWCVPTKWEGKMQKAADNYFQQRGQLPLYDDEPITSDQFKPFSGPRTNLSFKGTRLLLEARTGRIIQKFRLGEAIP